jgi:hypothetical protein
MLCALLVAAGAVTFIVLALGDHAAKGLAGLPDQFPALFGHRPWGRALFHPDAQCNARWSGPLADLAEAFTPFSPSPSCCF